MNEDEISSEQNNASYSMPKSENNDWYFGGAFIAGILVFIGVWIYAISEWGFLLGLIFGWIPAIIAGIIGGFLWPLIALIILWLMVSSR